MRYKDVFVTQQPNIPPPRLVRTLSATSLKALTPQLRLVTWGSRSQHHGKGQGDELAASCLMHKDGWGAICSAAECKCTSLCLRSFCVRKGDRVSVYVTFTCWSQTDCQCKITLGIAVSQLWLSFIGFHTSSPYKHFGRGIYILTVNHVLKWCIYFKRQWSLLQLSESPVGLLHMRCAFL